MNNNQISALLNEMTTAEKVGQLVQLTPDFYAQDGEITGPVQEWNLDEDQLYSIGSVLGTHTAKQVYTIQKKYLEKSRLKIPLIFMADVIHGYETIFPIPLGLAASFDKNLVEQVAEASAREAANAGVHVTFSPMADHVKDARWGRVLESNGEDPLLSSVLTAAYVRGYQGKPQELDKNKKRIAACVKHFIGYGAAEGGRDYNTVDLSEIELYQNYLPAFHAAIEAGAQLVMTSFNTINGIPVTANKQLIQEVLRKKLGFSGLVISDWGAVAELIAHRVAKDSTEATLKAFEAGVEMDMMSDCYLNTLEQLLQSAPLLNDQLNQAVLHVLQLKNKLGLFEDPYRGLEEQNLEIPLEERTRNLSRKAAEDSIVLLKNEKVLPITPKQRVALIGPKSVSTDVLGAWSWIGKSEEAISLHEGLIKKDIKISTLPFPDGEEITDDYIEKACQLAKKNEVVLIAVGETSEEAGEAASLAKLELSRNQEKLIQSVSKINQKVVTIIFSGRPLVLTAVEAHSQAILISWFPGSEGGNALANILIGESEPNARLPISFPRSVGQLPFSYAQLSTGRPKTNENKNQKYISRYMDEENDALFSFGSGIGYGECMLKETELTYDNDKLTYTLKCILKNTSTIDHTTILQVYSQDDVTEIARPTRELKKWRKVSVPSGKEKTIVFEFTKEDFAYIHTDLLLKSDPGLISLYVGFSSSSANLIGKITI
jgi:beta-glucosidase